MPDDSAAESARVERVEAILTGGYIGRDKAAEVAAKVPEARDRILGWLGAAADAEDWRRFERLAAAAVHLHPDGLAPILVRALAADATGVNSEDLVDMLGELRAPEAVEAIGRLVHRRRDVDGPFFPLCIKGIQALGEIGTPDAEQFLTTVATSAPGEWPDPLRWHAAEQLGIEDELGFDEDEMLGGV
ncbi:hypothetical protein DI272_25930 [Streptomyces sp. Act143]|uniref:hypothetical protein n=1 Tax=Streptomyces sp. Act143 TaxID=2200760 RepID=UPI000D6825CA|nr:hypothetical protein [Streptomyces sp. Act143]PWI17217.1 hypothetical protein DI272_25930 [Streptomyces sp. Act143]